MAETPRIQIPTVRIQILGICVIADADVFPACMTVAEDAALWAYITESAGSTETAAVWKEGSVEYCGENASFNIFHRLYAEE